MSNNPVCIFCRTLLQITKRRRVPGTVRGYKNYNLHEEKITKPQLRFPLLTKRKNEKENDAPHPSGLPMSPIMDKEEWDNRYKQPPKPSPGELKDLSPEQKELLRNPYARALASPIRADFYLRFRVPRAFLVPLSTVVNPTTNDPWVLPCDIKLSDSKKPEPKPRRYGLAAQHYFDFVSESPRRWGKVRVDGQGIPKSAIWRQDMGVFVLAQMRRRVVEELVSVRRCIVSANKENGKWKKPLVGCVLLWRRTQQQSSGSGSGEGLKSVTAATAEARAETTATAAVQIDPKLKETLPENDNGVIKGDTTQVTDLEENTTKDEIPVTTELAAVTKAKDSGGGSAPNLEGNSPEDYESLPARWFMQVGEKTVPTYDMEALLGRELASELRTRLKLEKEVMRNAIMTSDRSIAAQMWLLKLSGYISW